MDNEDDFDMYGDLGSTVASAPEPSTVTVTSSSRGAGAAASIASAALIEENDALKRNISILWRTAKAELNRKDKEIDKLNARIRELEQNYQNNNNNNNNDAT
ncbi:hypothetical protein TrST_g7546 [Triparma strigata]|uniref:Uncharacterized protein n=1 Tax=Triparma strigata TaxID=1606541 RepID=A0A9W6ZYC0_9STRA|nr:hypothetical protein TrST_g7546 [Triparma strigata]